MDLCVESPFVGLNFGTDMDFSDDIWDLDFTDLDSPDFSSSSSAEDICESSSGLRNTHDFCETILINISCIHYFS